MNDQEMQQLAERLEAKIGRDFIVDGDTFRLDSVSVRWATEHPQDGTPAPIHLMVHLTKKVERGDVSAIDSEIITRQAAACSRFMDSGVFIATARLVSNLPEHDQL
jgi:hypothetical protein